MFGRLFSKSKGSSGSGDTADAAPEKKVWLENCKFTDFKLGPILGTGSFGRVHLAHHVPTGQICATKSLSKASIVKTKQVLHVKQEKSILARISHPFVVNLLGFCQDDQCVHLVIEYVCGGEFFTYLRSTGRFDEQTTRFYASQVLCAFEYLHNMDIIYRDLKPENLLLDEKGNIKVTDFGFAKQIDRRTYTLCGTPDYLAPEIILNKGHGKPVDWWTFGVLIYEMLAGYPPFYDDDAVGTYQKILSGKVQFPGHFSRSAKDLLRRLLVADLTKRIGCLKGGVKDIKTHDWFKTVDWDSVVRKKDTPPIRPKVSSKDDTSCFDDYSKLGPMKHEFVLSADDQLLFKDL
ncbi:hypothetical protein KC19_2G149700 [Ceratodon purpureus]|uniref:Uncharacterized protein n=1 Tax=Ceratodon purpureus TaxID=3225 RepID=A0A8T0IU19_CERPU|nr:hypothetical protein KC19_2G149700 [Ceratodon purpureus]